MSLRTQIETRHVFGSVATATIPLVAGYPNQCCYLYKMIVTIGSPAITITVQDTASNAISQPFQLVANGALVLDIPVNMEPWWQTSIGLGLQLVQSGTTTVGYDIWYLQGP